MGEFDDHVAVMGDSMPISPSLRAFLSSISSDDVGAPSAMHPDSENQTENQTEPPFRVAEGHCPFGNADQNYQTQVSVGSDEASNTNALAEPKLSSSWGLVERIAARAGFDPSRLKLNTESIRPRTDLSKKPEVYCAYLTIPSGLSPTTLLESPVFLSNSQVMPSPTTGKLSLGPSESIWKSALVMGDPDRAKEKAFEDVAASSFAFKPHSISSPFINASFASFGASVPSDTACQHQSIEPPKLHSENNSALFEQANLSESHAEKNGSNSFLPEQAYNSSDDAENSPPFDELYEDGGQGFNGDPNVGGSPADDGYNWRKYGQKHVKGSEYPRSYYKCTHPSCPVKKKVERFHEGHITEIVYRGAHSHPKPPPIRRSALGSPSALGGIQPDSTQHGTSADCDLTWSVRREGNVVGAPDWKRDNLLAAPLGQENSNGSTATLQAQSCGQSELRDGADRSSTFSNNGDDDDRATHGIVSLGYDGEGDELESKRRRIEDYGLEMSARAIREPRVVVQTTSKVDVLDDGYRWRKYGQKVVKGNPNPRSYYKCTSHGCNVRKHVERASHDVTSVVTTYEGKHNHDVPAAKNSGHMNSGSSNVLASRRATVSASSVHIHGHEPSQVFGLTLPSFGMNQPGLAGLGLAGSGLNQGRSPFMPVHPYPGRLLRPVNDMSYMVPKGKYSWIQ